MNDAGLAEAIRSDAIDILVDLSGHTVHNRLLVLARKPAPVQATWLGYLSTTGLSAIDYRITDGFLDPPGMTEHLHTERLFRLPHAACYLPPPEAPAVSELPAWRTGYVTFGSLNQWSKVNARVRETWIELMLALPQSRLLAIAPGTRNPELVAALKEPFIRAGIETRRLQFVPPASLAEFLRTVASVDIALDPFPYGGGTTTLQCLWMGVPVVTLAGATSVARNAVGPLSTAGLGELVTPDRASYVAAAARLGGATQALRELRAGLRDRVRNGPLADAAAFARNLEVAYRQMWRTYCETTPN